MEFRFPSRFQFAQAKVQSLKLARLSEFISLTRDYYREQLQDSLPARLRESPHLQGIRSTWHKFNGQSGIFRQFAWARFISLKRDFTNSAHINRFFFSLFSFCYCFIHFFCILERSWGISRERNTKQGS